MPAWIGYDSVTHGDTAISRPGCPYDGSILAIYAAHYHNTAALKYYARYFMATTTSYEYVAPQETLAFGNSNAGFYYIVPIATPVSTRESMTGQTGRDYGTFDGNDVCDKIVRAIQAGGIGFPAGVSTYVYLDIEPDVALSTEYWEGWAGAVFAYQTPWLSRPFYPCAYANPLCVGRPANKLTMGVLRGHTTGATACWGFWSQQPTGRSRADCENNPVPSFSDATSDGEGWDPPGGDLLVMHYWQYGENGACIGVGTDGCRPTIDNNESNPGFDMTAYMLHIG